jgi:sortase A
VLITAAFFSLLFTIKALWIPLKAEIAQRLLSQTWQQILSGDEQARPWPWADTQPVAILLVPRFSIEQFVLGGNSGRNLAFGPVMLEGASEGKDRVISGHRDTHFEYLRDLRIGDLIHLTTASGDEAYVVERTEVVDSRRKLMIVEPSIQRLSLVTCYPFDAITSGGPLRYVITALPAAEETTRRNPLAASSG